MNLTEGKTLPEWVLKPINHHSVPSLTSFRGAPLLILFFNLGCAGCRGRAIPYAIRFSELYPNLQIIGIHTNFKGVDYLPGQVGIFLYKAGVSFPVFQDQDKQTYEKYRVEGTPHWLLVNGEGVLLKSIFGSMGNAIHRLDYSLTELFQQSVIQSNNSISLSPPTEHP